MFEFSTLQQLSSYSGHNVNLLSRVTKKLHGQGVLGRMKIKVNPPQPLSDRIAYFPISGINAKKAEARRQQFQELANRLAKRKLAPAIDLWVIYANQETAKLVGGVEADLSKPHQLAHDLQVPEIVLAKMKHRHAEIKQAEQGPRTSREHSIRGSHAAGSAFALEWNMWFAHWRSGRFLKSVAQPIGSYWPDAAIMPEAGRGIADAFGLFRTLGATVSASQRSERQSLAATRCSEREP